MEKNKFNKPFIIGITMVSAMGGLLFGYDWVVIGGAKPFYERFFQIAHSPSLQGWAMGSALIGCLFGAAASGYFTDRFGRKYPLIGAAVLFTVSAVGAGFANHLASFVFYRLAGGLGIGLASAVSPMYIAEIAPASMRGRLVSINQLTIVVGILAAQTVNYLIAEKVPAGATDEMILQSWNGQTGWRWMFWAGAYPALAFLVLAFLIPESPRYLARAGNIQKAHSTLARIGGKDYAEREVQQIVLTVREKGQKVNWKELLSPGVRPLILIGVVLAVFQQWCGINVIFNYAEEVFTSAGYSVGDMMRNIVITGIVNLVFTVVAMQAVDRWGRRKLMLMGSSGLALIYLLLGSCYFFELKGMAVLLMVVAAIAVYAMSLAPVTWVVLAEIFPNRVRGAAMAVATTALWTGCFALTYTFPLLNSLLKAGGTFWLYALICLSGFLFVIKKLPETKGKTLEEVEKIISNQS